uniref:RRM domain-containing protein n=1 Tax=Oryza punctata TaxID=4537 RepID=A0A0E0LWA8_ORYPU
MGKAEARSREHGGGGGGGGGGGSGSAGKIFVGGLPRDTTEADFVKHFGQYGEIVDSVIMRDKHTSQPRGFGFITYSNPAVVDSVMDDIHEFNGKQVEIKRTIPKDSMQSKDFKTKKIFVGGLPQALTEDDFKHFFQKYGTVVDHQIMRDHQTKRSRGFGFIVFSSDQVVDDLLANGNMIDLAGAKVEIKKAEPKKSSNPPSSSHGSASRSAYGRDSRGQSSGNGYGGLANAYSNYNSGGFGPYRNHGVYGGGSLSGYGGIGEYGIQYGRYYPGLGGSGGMPSFGYASRVGPYGGGFEGPYAGGNLSGYRRGGDDSFGGLSSSSFGGAMYGGAVYDPALGGYASGSTPERSRGNLAGGSGRYNPYGR